MTPLDYLMVGTLIGGLLLWSARGILRLRVTRRPHKPQVDPESGPPDVHCL